MQTIMATINHENKNNRKIGVGTLQNCTNENTNKNTNENNQNID